MSERSSDILARLDPGRQAEVRRQLAGKPCGAYYTPPEVPTADPIDPALGSGSFLVPAESITITLPLPSKCLSPNARAHWRTKAKAVKEYRWRACAEALEATEAQMPRWTAASIQAVFYHPQRRRRDHDNLAASLKSAVDGLVDAGLLADDDQITWLPVVKLIDPEYPRVMLVVTRTEARP